MSAAAGSKPQGNLGLVWLTIAALAALAILVALGLWQLERRAWKVGLIERITQRVAAAPVSLAQARAVARETGDVEYLRIAVRGAFTSGTQRWVYAPTASGLGYNLIQALLTADGELVLVNRGWVPEAVRTDPARAGSLAPSSSVEVVGLARRQPVASAFSAAANLARDEFYWPDYDGIIASLPGDLKAGRTIVPFAIDAQSEAPRQAQWPRPGTTNLDLPNRHLEYALTWFGLAATLVGVYIALLLTGRRRPG